MKQVHCSLLKEACLEVLQGELQEEPQEELQAGHLEEHLEVRSEVRSEVRERMEPLHKENWEGLENLDSLEHEVRLEQRRRVSLEVQVEVLVEAPVEEHGMSCNLRQLAREAESKRIKQVSFE